MSKLVNHLIDHDQKLTLLSAPNGRGQIDHEYINIHKFMSWQWYINHKVIAFDPGQDLKMWNKSTQAGTDHDIHRLTALQYQ